MIETKRKEKIAASTDSPDTFIVGGSVSNGMKVLLYF
jgi:hypothetical protein